jgi:hypothetical protein
MLQLELERDPSNTKASREAKRLQKLHERTWLAPIRPILGFGGARFRRGFPVEATLEVGDDPEAREAARHPALSTFEMLRGEVTRALGPHLRALRELEVRGAQTAVVAAELPSPLRVEKLNVDIGAIPDASLAQGLAERFASSGGRGLPSLRTLVWRTSSLGSVDTLLRSWVAERVKDLTVYIFGPDLRELDWATLLERFASCGTGTPERLAIGMGRELVALFREGTELVAVMDPQANRALGSRARSRGFVVRVEK